MELNIAITSLHPLCVCARADAFSSHVCLFLVVILAHVVVSSQSSQLPCRQGSCWTTRRQEIVAHLSTQSTKILEIVALFKCTQHNNPGNCNISNCTEPPNPGNCSAFKYTEHSNPGNCSTFKSAESTKIVEIAALFSAQSSKILVTRTARKGQDLQSHDFSLEIFWTNTQSHYIQNLRQFVSWNLTTITLRQKLRLKLFSDMQCNHSCCKGTFSQSGGHIRTQVLWAPRKEVCFQLHSPQSRETQMSSWWEGEVHRFVERNAVDLVTMLGLQPCQVDLVEGSAIFLRFACHLFRERKNCVLAFVLQSRQFQRICALNILFLKTQDWARLKPYY